MRLMHTMLRVTNLDRALAFYCDVLDMTLIRRKDYAEGRFTLAFVGYGEESANTVLELTYNYGVEKYDPGSAFGHLAVEVPDAAKACEQARTSGGKVTREAGPVKFGTTVIAFVEDPDGYKIEFIQKGTM